MTLHWNTFITQKSLTIAIIIVSIIFYGSILLYLLPTKVAFKYQIASQRYLNGTLDKERQLDFSPLYFYVHIAARKFLEHPDRFILWVQILLGAFSAAFLFHILHSFFSFPISLMGTLAFITNRSVVLYTGVFEPEPFMIFFVLGFLLFALKSYGYKPLLSGIFLSLSLLTRSNFFPLIVFTPVFFWLRDAYKRRLFRALILFEIPIIIALSFLLIRNTLITGSFTPISMNPGYVFFEGNNPNSTGESAIYPPLVNDIKPDVEQQPDVQHVIYRLFARNIKDRSLSISEVNAYWGQKAKNFIFDHPVYFLKRLLTKISFFFHNYRRHDLSNVYWNDQILQKTIPALPYALLSALALIGMVLGVNTWKKSLLIYAVFFSQFGIMLLTYVSDRQRVVLIAIMIFFASETLQAIARKKYYLLLIPIALALFPLLYIHNDLMKDGIHTWNSYARSNQCMQEARQARKQGNWQLASEKNAMALALAPVGIEDRRLAQLSFGTRGFQGRALEIATSFQERNFSALFDVTILSLEAGKLADAKRLLHELINGNYSFNRQHLQSSQPYFYLARIYERHNKKSEAIIFLEKALHKKPGDPWALSLLTALTNNPLYKTKIFRYFDEIDAEFFLGRAYLETLQFDKAVKSFSYVAEKLPEYRRGRIYLSIALSGMGRYEQAVEQYLYALKARREPIFREKEILNIFHSLVGQHPQNIEARYYRGIILQEFGFHKEALKIQEEILEQYADQLDEKNLKNVKRAINRSKKILQAYHKNSRKIDIN